MVTIEIKDDQIGPALARLSAHLSNILDELKLWIEGAIGSE